MKENVEQTQQAQEEQKVTKKKCVSPFWKGVITTVAIGCAIYGCVKYRKEIVSYGKSAVKKGKNLFNRKKPETVVVNEVVFAEETRPQRTISQPYHKHHGWNNKKEVKR